MSALFLVKFMGIIMIITATGRPWSIETQALAHNKTRK